ncbi:MAG: ferrochelatase [Bacteroidota bacterium]|jgi:ferrochelatase|nr:ferrochelatase [Bacteroidota bacterium]
MDNLGVILLNMGGPTSLDAVRPFLQNLFLDREIISFGPMEFARAPLAKFIAKKRAEIVKKNYAMIGGKSPIAELSRAQAAALERTLAARYGSAVRVRVEVGFSYWHPFIAEAMDALKKDGYTNVFLMPLYPHYSKTTTGSCFKTWRDLHRAHGNRVFKVQSVKAYPLEDGFVDAINERIDEGMRLFPEERRAGVTLLFSAHGTPVKLVEQGDPYSFQIRATMEEVMRRRTDGLPYHLSFQSKVGPATWLTPDTVTKTKELAAAGVRDLLVIPIAFVTDHIETLHELGIDLREDAIHAGIEYFHVMPALNSSEKYISALAGQIVRRMDRVRMLREGVK